MFFQPMCWGPSMARHHARGLDMGYITSVEVTSCNFDSGIHQVRTNLCGLLAGVLLHFLCVENLTLRAVDFLVVAVLRQ